MLTAVVVHDALAPTPFHHHRSPVTLVFAGALATALLVARAAHPIARRRSRRRRCAAAARSRRSSPASPGAAFPIRSSRGGIAFNLADVAIAGGDALLLVAVLLHAWTNRARLREPI